MKNFKDFVNEKSAFGIYHKSYTEAINAALEYAKKEGYSYDEEETASTIGLGSKRPSEGTTNRFSISLYKNGELQKKQLHIQVYGMTTKYELNCYIQ